MIILSKFNKIFYRFLITYLIILLIPVAFGLISYNRAYKTIEKNTIEANNVLLNQTKEIIERHLEEVDSISMLLSNNKRIKNFSYLKDPFKGANTYQTIKLKDELQKYNLVNEFIISYFVCFQKSKLVLGPNLISPAERFYGHYLDYTNINYEQWYQQVFNTYHQKDFMPAMMVNLNDKKYKAVSYLSSFGYSDFPLGTVIILIDNKKIKNLLAGLDTSRGGWACIVDEKGQLISSQFSNENINLKDSLTLVTGSGSIEKTINKQKYLITYKKSNINGWQYMAGLPVNVVMEEVYHIKRSILIYLFISIILGIIVATFMANRNTRPLQNIFKAVRKSSTEKNRHNTLKFLQESVTDLVNNNSEMEALIEEQKTILKSTFLDKLFRGDFSTTKNVKTMLRYTGLHLKGTFFVISIIRIDDYEEFFDDSTLRKLKLKRVLINDVINKIVSENPGKYVIHNIDGKKIVLLMEMESSDKIRCKSIISQTIKQILNMLKRSYEIKAIAAIGGMYKNIVDISQSYQEAYRALNYRKDNKETEVCWFNDIKINSSHYYFPLEIETRLINVVKTGDQKQLDIVIDNLYKENFTKRKLSFANLQQLIYELQGTVCKIVEQLSWEKDQDHNEIEMMLDKIEEIEYVEEKFNYTVKIFQKITLLFNEYRKRQKNRLVDEIIMFTEKKYIDNNFGLSMIAGEFDLSEAYVSQIFKEYTGEKFYSYLEKLRMDKACELLAGTDLAIKKIAQKTGYNCANTFSRAFKRKKGVPPTKYRNTSL